MMRLSVIIFGFAIATVGCTNGLDSVGSTGAGCKEHPPPKVLCRVTGGGQILAGENPDTFGGNAQPFRTYVGGHWNHITHEGDHLIGRPDTIECFTVEGDPAAPPDAPANAARFSGTGTWNGEEGCEFTVYVEDHGEPATQGGAPGTDDFYSIEITCESGATYSAGDTLLHGNIQIHDVPPGHMPAG